jgi:serine/threonine-protein kinase
MAEDKQSMIAYCPECGEEYDSSFNACPTDGAKLYHYRAGEWQNDPLLGEVVDERFRIEQVLGEGGMGKVYRAMQLSVDRPVALKVLNKAVDSNQEFIKRFLREARVISGFNHPNIVRLVDFGQDSKQDLLYLVMEMLDGADLAGLIERGRFKVALAVEIALQVCAALSEPHAHEVVHRDLKPENLILVVTSDGSLQVKVLDFGIAQAVEGDAKLTKTGVVYGTPTYMAPEQAQGVEMTNRTDIYALGIILFQMLVGRPPFEGDTAMQIILAHVQSPAPQMLDFLEPGDVPQSLIQLVEDMIRKAPDQRPASVLEVRDRLEAIQAELGLARVRLDGTASFDEMFDPWLLEPFDMEARSRMKTPAIAASPKEDDVAVEPERAAASTERVTGEPASDTVISQASASKKSKLGLFLVIALLVVLVGGAAVWLLMPTMGFVRPFSKDSKYVLPWSEDSNYVMPWSDEAAVPWSEGDGDASKEKATK